MENGQWAVGSGQWAMGNGQWTVGSGQWRGQKANGLRGGLQISFFYLLLNNANQELKF
jgi:hypothetical protein